MPNPASGYGCTHTHAGKESPKNLVIGDQDDNQFAMSAMDVSAMEQATRGYARCAFVWLRDEEYAALGMM